jgi:hypothetical protein
VKAVKLSRDEWDLLLPTFADATYEQTCAYAGAAWPGRETLHMGIADGSEIVAACQVILFRLPLLSRGLAVVKNGPLWRRRGTNPNPLERDNLLRVLIEECAIRRRLGLRILPHVDPASEHGTAVPGSELEFRETSFSGGGRYFVNLDLDEGAQRASLSGSWRHRLKKAEAAGLQITAGRGSEALNIFMRLHAGMLSRKRYSERTWIGGLPRFIAEIPASYSPQIYLARRGVEIVAGAVIGAVGETASYLYGASAEAALPLHAGYALQWRIIRDLSARPDLHSYDLGGDSGSEGLRQFKSGLIGKAGRILTSPGQFDYCRDPISAALTAASGTARRAMLFIRRNDRADAPAAA